MRVALARIGLAGGIATSALALGLGAGISHGADGAAHLAQAVAGEQTCQPARPDRDYNPAPSDARQAGTLGERLRLAEAHRIATGAGVGVAVLDTGLDPTLAPGASMSARINTVAVRSVPGMKTKLYDAHGTQTAALVSGMLRASGDRPAQAIGVAPGAHVVPIRVADGGADVVAAFEDDRLTGVEAKNVAAGVLEAVRLRRSQQIKVISISLSITAADPALNRAIKKAQRAGMLVVASAGNRSVGESEAEKARNAFRPGEDEVPYPGRLDGVLTVTAADRDGSVPTTVLATGPSIDVSAPGEGLLTLGVEGRTCELTQVATSWAVPQVAGLAALVFEEFADERITAAQVRTRIEATARGGYGNDALDGNGMIQPLAALTADLDVAADGTLRTPPVVREEAEELAAPQAPDDALADARHSMRWWGLGAGGALVLALLVRPLLARRR